MSAIAIVGGGPAGLAAAALLAKAGLAPVLHAGPSRDDDPRTVALMRPAIRLLAHLDLWPGALQAVSAPLRRLRLVDETGATLAAPDITFAAEELGEPEFGWNIPLRILTGSLREAAARHGCEIVEASVAHVSSAKDHVVLTSNGATRAFRVALAADGRQSSLREAAGIAANRWSYDQSAIATSFGHTGPHHETSTEYHTPEGPFTTVPLPGRRSSLVWMLKPKRAEAMMALPDDAFAAEIQLMCHGDLGRVGDIGRRRSFAMSGLTARAFAQARIMLLGEAAHTLPPIGAQGLNISLRDAALAAELIEHAIHDNRDPGGSAVLSDYDTARRADILPRQFAVDLMNRSLLISALPLDAARALALHVVDRVAPLRRAVMRQGVAPNSGLPLIMR
jgi:2-octaprenyl-6-methoxyphenol hydroxylase